MLFICLFPSFVGVLVAIWASRCFKEPHVHPRAFSSRTNDPESQPILSKIAVENRDRLAAMRQIFIWHWFGRGPKTYSYITSIVGWVLIVGACQFIFADWYLMIQEGDRDHCYYTTTSVIECCGTIFHSI